MSRFGDGKLVWAIFCWQTEAKTTARKSKPTPHSCQRLPQNRIARRFTDIRSKQSGCCKVWFLLPASVPHHRGAEEREDLINWIRDRAGAAARIEQTHRPRTGCDIFDHQRSRIAAIQKLTAAICDHDLAGERLCECRATCTFVIVG